ncbi:MAG: amino acid ABC transporter permease [Clostridiales bacterium]|nr:amino acid ABC transporter permease [Clostridiales bacterium]
MGAAKGYLDALVGLQNTLLISVAALAIGLIIGTLMATIKLIPSSEKLPVKVLKKIVDAYVALFRGTPIVVQLLIMYFVALPLIGLARVPPLIVAMIAFGLNSGAYVSEMVRGGILSVDKGQMEAGRTLGLTYVQTMKLIILPQAIKNIVPMIGNEFIALIKETSVVSFIAVIDLTKAFKQIGDATYEYIIPYLMLALCYLILVLGITYLLRLVERRMRRSDRD